MRITRQLLKKFSSFPLEEVEYINLSDNDIVAIERLEACKRLQTLILCNNQIDSIRNVYCCRQLWTIDLTGNKVKSLGGLSRYPVLGVLSLGYNDLDWKELKHLSHMTIVSLTLLGNGKLDSDPHYREHVIDALPHVWRLDGRLVSAEEKRHVSQFFNQSQLSAQPVRHKLKVAESVFVPTSMKNLLVTGVFGEKTTHLMTHFPVNYTHNVEMDKRRLSYLAYSIHQEQKLYQQHTPRLSLLPDLETLMEGRSGEIEQCNMLLLLLMAGLKYDLPSKLMRATLETAKLDHFGDVNCAELLNLPSHLILDFASLLLSAAAVDKEEKKHEGSLYPGLYKSLCVTMDSVQKKILAQRAKIIKCNTDSPRKISPEKEAFLQQCHCLLASEVIHLMCLVPLFFECMDSSEGLMQMIAVATKAPKVSDVIGSIAWKAQSRGGDIWDVYHDVASYLLEATSANVKGKRKKTRKSLNVHRTTSQLLQSTEPKASVRALRALSAGAASRRLRTRVSPKSAYCRSHREPELGDLVLVSDDQAARIVALPEPGVAVLQMNSRTVISCPPDSYFYTDTRGLTWDRQMSCWIKDDLAADLSRSQLSPSPPHSTIALPSSSSLDSSDSGLRSETPDLSSYCNSVPHLRPLSQMSHRSDDLQTILSEDELDEDSADEETPAGMRVDVATSNAGGSGTPQFEHHKHVLQQYSAHSLAPDLTTHAQNKPTDFPTNKEDSSSLSPEGSHAERDILLTVPPKVHLVNSWDIIKSLPSSSQLASKPHSCHEMDSLRESAKMEPHMSPLRSHPSTRLFQGNTGSGDQTRQQPALIQDAWTPVSGSNVNVKTTLTSSSRIMKKRQPKTPPLTRNSRASSGYRPESGGSSHISTSTVILQQRTSRSAIPTSPSHFPMYRSHSQNSMEKFHYPPSRSASHGGNTRKLGDMRSLYIGGTSIS